MSTRIVCTVDHSATGGSAAGALISIHLEGDQSLDSLMRLLVEHYPNCHLKAVTS
jgi:hypothetical protein